MSKDDLVRLRHMLDSAMEAVELIQGKSRADLDTNRVLNLALVRLLEIVGEAATRVTTATRQQYPNIPWSQIVSLRNRLIHGYDAIDMDILWKILVEDLPELFDELQRATIVKIAIDSNILSYFVDATIPCYDPLNDEIELRNARISTIQIPLYNRNNVEFHLMPLVEIEWRRISDDQRRILHEMATFVLCSSYPWKIDQNRLNSLISKFMQYHPQGNDCRLLAEAELTGMDILLTNDNDFINRLSNKSTVKIFKSSQYMENLNIKKGTPPKLRPNKSNPLSNKTWWVI